MRIPVIAALILTSATPAFADQPYLYDLVKRQPYKNAYASLMEEMSEPPDYAMDVFKPNGNYLAFPAKSVKVGSWDYTIAMICEPNVTCAEYGAVFLFTSDGNKAWGAIRDGDKPETYLGNPSDSQKQALDQAFDNPD
jgi:hypothetical protein